MHCDQIDKFLDNRIPEYETGDEVDLLIAEKTDLGFKAIVDGSFWGMIYENEIFTPVETGLYLKGYIKKVRDDDKLDISLQKEGYDQVDGISQNILEKLKDNEYCVNSLTEMLGYDPSTVSKHLSILKNAGLISDEKRGLKVFYKLRTPCVLDMLYCVNNTVKQAAERNLEHLKK
jgi:DNA-binding transcriptional ArsR family regulator